MSALLWYVLVIALLSYILVHYKFCLLLSTLLFVINSLHEYALDYFIRVLKSNWSIVFLYSLSLSFVFWLCVHGIDSFSIG